MLYLFILLILWSSVNCHHDYLAAIIGKYKAETLTILPCTCELIFTPFCIILSAILVFSCFLCFLIYSVNRVLTFSTYMMFQTFGMSLFYFVYVNSKLPLYFFEIFCIVSKFSMTLFQKQNAHEAILKQLALHRWGFIYMYYIFTA